MSSRAVQGAAGMCLLWCLFKLLQAAGSLILEQANVSAQVLCILAGPAPLDCIHWR